MANANNMSSVSLQMSNPCEMNACLFVFIQRRPYDKTMYMMLVPYLKRLAELPVPWNGGMDWILEGFEASMRWIGARMRHCNRCV